MPLILFPGINCYFLIFLILGRYCKTDGNNDIRWQEQTHGGLRNYIVKQFIIDGPVINAIERSKGREHKKCWYWDDNQLLLRPNNRLMVHKRYESGRVVASIDIKVLPSSSPYPYFTLPCLTTYLFACSSWLKPTEVF